MRFLRIFCTRLRAAKRWIKLQCLHGVQHCRRLGFGPAQDSIERTPIRTTHSPERQPSRETSPLFFICSFHLIVASFCVCLVRGVDESRPRRLAGGAGRCGPLCRATSHTPRNAHAAATLVQLEQQNFVPVRLCCSRPQPLPVGRQA